MIERSFPGACWWKFDFHTHTPASYDFEDEYKDIDPEEWLRKFMDKEIDCVAITDHNSGDWVDRLKSALVQLELEPPQWYRPIVLFPGVEISVQGGLHMLAILDTNCNTADIDGLLGAVRYDRKKGPRHGFTTLPANEVIEQIAKAGGVAIPAHVDKEKGLLSCDFSVREPVFNNDKLLAIEVCEDGEIDQRGYGRLSRMPLSEVHGSDVHDFDNHPRFGDFTWVKMEDPSMEGLKLALIDGWNSIDRGMENEPNKHAEFWIESLEVENATYMGNDEEQPMRCKFSPFLNTIIGGRGSGKSTLLEFMRLVLRREAELPASLVQGNEKYYQAGENGLLRDESVLHLIYRKGYTRYKLNWAANPQEASLQEWDPFEEEWQDLNADIRSLFPVSIYSQKQIFELANDRKALMKLIDRDEQVDFTQYESKHAEYLDAAMENQRKSSALSNKINQRTSLNSELAEVNRQIKVIESSGHAHTLKIYRDRKQQLDIITGIEQRYEYLLTQLHNALSDIDINSIDSPAATGDVEIDKVVLRGFGEWGSQLESVKKAVARLAEWFNGWKQEIANATFMEGIRIDMKKYQQLKEQFENADINPADYPKLLERKALIQKQIQQIAIHENNLKQSQNEYTNQILNTARENRRLLSERRKSFLQQLVRSDQFVQISLLPSGEPWSEAEVTLREILRIEAGFEKDFEVIADIYNSEDSNRFEYLKQYIIDLWSERRDAKDVRFVRHLKSKMYIDVYVNLHLWYPEDSLKITFGGKQKDLYQGSPGQKTAALLAFIFSYGDDPLLLDQPEDDLDNQVIQNLVLGGIGKNKKKRQIIIATHNANIVVNGNSEMIFPLQVSHGETSTDAKSLQNEHIRTSICNIMEGGKQAFEQRYRRIRLETQ